MFSSLLPHTAAIAHELAVVHTMHTDQFNHDPAVTFLNSGAALPGRPAAGSWVSTEQDLLSQLPRKARETDQASAALITDLKQRGLLEDTLVIWGGQFGRTPMVQSNLPATRMERDHHPRAFTIWMAGGGVRPGTIYGSTDDFGYNVTENPVHVHDFQATLLHCLGIDHKRLTYKFQGRDYRLTDVHGHVIHDLLS